MGKWPLPGISTFSRSASRFNTAASPFLYEDRIYRVGMEIVPDKVLFGSDYPLLRARHFLKRIRGVGLSEAEQRALLGGNAARLFGWSEGHDG